MSWKGWLSALIILILIILSGSLFTINQVQEGLLVRLGKVQYNSQKEPIVLKPGLHAKWPFFEQVKKFDMRLRTLTFEEDNLVTEDRQTVDVSAFINWRIDNLMKYYLATSAYGSAVQNLTSRVQTSIRDEFGKLPLTDLVAGQRVNVMEKIQQIASEKAKSLGIKVIDVRINKIALPQQTLQRVYNNMRTEFSTQATKIRAQGIEQAEKIKANADMKKTIILAKAKETAANTIALGQSESGQIYANAYKSDPKFYSFYRSLESYQNVFTSNQDTLILSPKGNFFKYFNKTIQENGIHHNGLFKNNDKS